ncbi:alpha/beta fold hydrolase [Desulfovibrio litoralis]|uniref:Pimeloyl-ACP methyl ester carboxylesterase n=1 Tax=Desulfovibrio litoralis DSM 11393 TaxID=1121455 RepID=A0A1M7TPL8_9BACT|nr:alpha/beta hydrolase [Desulfovibrio litoralis]SHN72655.1 Pimeloyl-ACP methyl ester carboxylesterase [Desulfovibrio litoralis DSM 11393]
MSFAPYKNCQIEYSVTGKGKGLVLVHGTGQSAENTWTEVAKHFSSKRTVVCPNYSGSGRTQDSNEPLTIELLAEQVLATAEHAGLQQFDIAGHSLGTCVAMYLAANYPDRVGKVILLAGFTSTEDARSQLQFRMWKEMAETNPKLLAETFLFTAFSPAFVAGMPDCAVKDTVEAIFTTTDWKGTARQIDLDLRINVMKEARAMQQETLVVGCVHDYIIPIAHSKELMKVISNAQYAEMETGHGGCVENLEQFISIVDGFLA